MKFLKYFVYTFLSVIGLFLLIVLIYYTPDIPVETLRNKYATDDSQFEKIDDMQVHFRDQGNMQDSIPLVLIHGTSASLMTWDGIMPMIDETRRVIRFDLPAFALTGPNQNNDYSIEYYVEFVKTFLERRGVKQCVLVGNSLGGAITWEFALKYPNRVSQMILIDAAGYPIDFAEGSLGFRLAKIPVVKNILKLVTPLSIVEKSLHDVYGDDSKVTPELVELYSDMTRRTGNRAALIARFNQPFSYKHGRISQIPTPTLIIWGELDQLTPVTCGFNFDKDLPNSELIVLKDIGHVPMEEAPEIVGPLLNDFIKYQ